MNHRYGDQQPGSRRTGDTQTPYRQCVVCGVRKRTVEKLLSGYPHKARITQYSRHPYLEWTAERPDCGKKVKATATPETRRKLFLQGKRGRFEDLFYIEHCGQRPKCLGNYSLRESGAGPPYTSVGYECVVCRQQFLLVDTVHLNTPAQQAQVNAEHDAVE